MIEQFSKIFLIKIKILYSELINIQVKFEYYDNLDSKFLYL
jgi:hypothetical protein